MAAEWSVENTWIISELFAAQVNAGNRPGNYLTPNAFDEVGRQFKMRTGLDYTYTQLKNKWDKLKGDFSLFKKLKFRETGAGWDYVNNTVSQDDEWWKKAKIDIKGCGKFKKKGLANEENLRIIFGDITSDGTDHWNPSMHVRASIPEGPSKIRYIGRTGATTQNVMAVCDFDMYFTYASIGQPGSMHDTSVLFHAIENDKATFPHPPKGKYYLVDAGYPNRDGYLAPYKGERYHVPDFQRGAPPTTPIEKFNRIHSSKRNTIERAFGVWKMKWQILLKMPNYSITTQKMIVAAIMTLHNYVRLHDKDDVHFLRYERDPDYVLTIPDRYKKYVIPPNASDASTSAESAPNMDLFRHELATTIALSW